MPRYYFHFRGSGANDLDGQDLPDDAAAVAEAKVVAGELRVGRNDSSEEYIVVTKENGETIHEEPLARLLEAVGFLAYTSRRAPTSLCARNPNRSRL